MSKNLFQDIQLLVILLLGTTPLKDELGSFHVKTEVTDQQNVSLYLTNLNRKLIEEYVAV